jgi:large subunit ribosomal protein L15
MKLHELHPAAGSRTRRTRVGRGIAAGGGKTAGRGTKGQKARAGGSIPAWFEGGQTPLHMRIPKLRGFRNPFKIEYEVVNLGRIAALVELGALEPGEPAETPKAKGSKAASTAAPITVNQEILRAVGLVRTLDKPMKVLGQGEIDRALFVVADAFSKSAVAKIEAAGGSVQVLQIPTSRQPALGVETPVEPAEAGAAVSAEPVQATATVEATGQPSGEPAAEAAEATVTVESAERAAQEPSAPAKRARPSAAATPKSQEEAKPQEAKAARSPKAATAPKTAKAKAASAPKASKPAATAGPDKPARTPRKAADVKAADATAADAAAAQEPARVDDETSPEAPAGTDA